MASFWAAIIYSIVSVVLIFTQTPRGDAVAEAVLRAPFILMQVAAWVTLIFAALEFVRIHYPEKLPAVPGLEGDWSPADLPPLGTDVAHGKKQRSFAHAVAEAIFGFLALVWLLLVPEHPYLMFGPGAYYLHLSPFQLAPVWVQFYWWVVALNVLQVSWHCVELLRGSWRGERRAQNIAISAIGLIPLVVLLGVRDRAYVLLKHPELDQAQYGATLTSINQAITWGLEVICAITVLRLVWEIGRLGVEAYRKRLAGRK